MPWPSSPSQAIAHQSGCFWTRIYAFLQQRESGNRSGVLINPYPVDHPAIGDHCTTHPPILTPNRPTPVTTFVSIENFERPSRSIQKIQLALHGLSLAVEDQAWISTQVIQPAVNLRIAQIFSQRFQQAMHQMTTLQGSINKKTLVSFHGVPTIPMDQPSTSSFPGGNAEVWAKRPPTTRKNRGKDRGLVIFT